MLLKEYFTITIIYIICAMVSCYTVKDVNSLKAKLMEGYNKHTQPLPGKQLNVSVVVSINSIGDLDEQTEKLSTDMELITIWEDESLAWHTNETDIKSIELHPSQVWVPEIFVYNRHHGLSIGSLITHDLPIYYASNGLAFFVQFLIAETACDLDMSNFPFDRHICTVEFKVNKWRVSVSPELKEVLLRGFKPDGSWNVTNAKVDGDGRTLSVHIEFERKATFILLNLILPMVLLALLSPIVFLLPNQSGERVAFSVTVLLTISVYMTIISDFVPKKSDPMPLISIMLFISYSFTSLVIIVVIINARIYRLPKHVIIPRFLLFLLSVTKCLCHCFRRRNKPKEWENEEEIESLTKSDQSQAKRKRNICWKDVSWAIDMFFMILIYVMEIVLIVVFLIVLKFKPTQG